MRSKNNTIAAFLGIYLLTSIQAVAEKTPLHSAVSDGETRTVKQLLEAAKDKGAYVMNQDSSKRTALHIAAHKGLDDIVKKLLNAAKDKKIDLLFIKDSSDNTALHNAAERGYPEVVKLLVEAAQDKKIAYINEKNYKKETAIDLAKNQVKGPKSSELIKLLENTLKAAP